MLGIKSHTNDPAFNIATEQFLLKNINDNIFYLYINKPSIIVGKHQNTLAEINFEYTQQMNIPVFRRLSGGGTVYHDLGNINFCFITSGEKGKLVDFEKYAAPIVLALEGLGINVTTGKRHEIIIAGKKISGNASHVFKNRSLHHGTLLFSSDLSILNKCLKTDPLKFKDRAVKSVRSEVTNISDHLDTSHTAQWFIDYIYNFLLSHFTEANPYVLSTSEIAVIQELVSSKYNTWKWNYGYSPIYELNRRLRDNEITIQAKLKVEKGLIKELSFRPSDSRFSDDLNNLSERLLGTQHNENEIKKVLEDSGDELGFITSEKLIRLFF